MKTLTRAPKTEALLEKAYSSEPSKYYLGSVGAPMVRGSCTMLGMMLAKSSDAAERERASLLRLRACRTGVVSECEGVPQ